MKLKEKFKLGDAVLFLLAAASILAIIFEPQITSWINMIQPIGNAFIDAIISKLGSIVQSLEIIFLSCAILRLITLFSALSFKKKPKMLTIMSLLTSVLKWVVVIIIILLVLSVFGVDTATLLASAGILTLVIGLGAQTLIADILAGFFLVFEGEYQVGDIVSIDGWRGTVKDIGIRVTRLVDAGGNIKTINNSDVKNVVNQTSELSVAKVYMPIDYDESLERVELILKENLPVIGEKLKDVVEGPFYKGVAELGESSVNLLIIAKCKEEEIFQVQRDLTRELYLVFNENHITIPFNQIVISKRAEEEKTVSIKDKKKAEKFLEQQKKLTTDVVEDENRD